MELQHFRKLRDANEARQREWDKEDGITAAYRGNELAGEVGEACNIIKKLERERLDIRGSRSTPSRLAEELADIVICTDLIAMHYDIDLDFAVVRKFNATSEKVGLASRLSDRPTLSPESAAVTVAEPESGFIADVIAERIRQITAEGFTAEHDDQHECGELAIAGACYALAAGGNTGFTDRLWPWEHSWWKPSLDDRRNLVKAAALLIAEGERLDCHDGRTVSPAPSAPNTDFPEPEPGSLVGGKAKRP